MWHTLCSVVVNIYPEHEHHITQCSTSHRNIDSGMYIIWLCSPKTQTIAYFFKCFYVIKCYVYVEWNIRFSKYKTSFWMLVTATFCLSSWLFYWQYFCRLYTSEEYYYLGTTVDEKVFGMENIHTNSTTLSQVDIHYGWKEFCV